MAARNVDMTAAPGRAEAGGDGTRIPARPRVVATICAALVLLAFALLSPAHAVVAGIALVALTVLAAIDLRAGVIPNRIVLPATGLVLVAQLALFPQDVAACVLAALAGAVLMAVPRIFSRDAVGMGDVKLALLLGAAVGWAAFAALLLAFVCAFPFALGAVIREGRAARRHTLPFAPFVVCGAVVIIFGPPIAG